MTACLLCRQLIVHHYAIRDILWARYFYADQICDHCRHNFLEINQQTACPQCGRQGRSAELCPDCQEYANSKQEQLHNDALFQYNTAMHDYFQAYKRHGNYQLRQLFAGSLRQRLASFQADYLFVYIPTSATHFLQRQFDPVLGLFGDLCPLTPFLERNQVDWHQSTLKRAQRLQAPQIFATNSDAELRLTKDKILLLDDIYTTGTTLRRGMAAIRASGFTGVIESLTLAR